MFDSSFDSGFDFFDSGIFDQCFVYSGILFFCFLRLYRNFPFYFSQIFMEILICLPQDIFLKSQIGSFFLCLFI